MKPIKIFGLAALAALMAMAFAGASSAMASNTQLCTTDPGGGSCSTAATSVHAVSVGKGKLLSGTTVECNVLFSSLSVGALGAPQVITGHFTYTNCGLCTVKEVSASSTIKVLRTGHETAEVTGEGEVLVNCFAIFDCIYDGQGLNGTAKGPLLSLGTRPNGEVTISGQGVHPVSDLCEPGFLDLTMTPLVATYIGT